MLTPATSPEVILLHGPGICISVCVSSPYKECEGMLMLSFCMFNHLSATWHSSAKRGTAKERCELSSAKAFNGQVREI
jgi:hypothetical protein